MEKRLIVAMVLSALVMIVFFQLVPPRPQEAPPQEAARKEPVPAEPVVTPIAELEAPVLPTAEPTKPTEAAGLFSPLEDREREWVTRDTDLYHASFSNAGGLLTSLLFKNYFIEPVNQITNPDFNGREPGDGHDPRLDLLNTTEVRKYALAVNNLAGDHNLETALYKIVDDGNPNTVTFEHLTADGLRITKTYTLPNEQYGMGVRITFRNEATEPQKVEMKLTGVTGMEYESRNSHELTAMIVTGSPAAPEETSVDTIDLVKAKEGSSRGFLAEPKTVKEGVLWVGIANSFFGSALIPEPVKGQTITGLLEPVTTEIENRDDARAAASLLYKSITLKPEGGEQSYALNLFIGPREYEAVAPFKEQGLEEIVRYDSFPVLGHIIAGALKLFYRVLRNYGLAIIALTIVVRLLMYPLTKKQQISLHHMNKLKPMMDEVRKKHKNDKPKQQQETMALYKEHGINPLAGCLPLLVQMPVFIGLFYVLRNFPGFRHAVFIPGLFVDLAAADHIFKLPFGSIVLPLVGPLQHLNILPILMSTMMFLQQKQMPKSDDPQMAQQQKMMSFMMIFFGLILYNYQAGLALYMITSTGIGMAQQSYIKKHIREIDEKIDAHKRKKEIADNKGITVKSSNKRKPA